MSAELRAVLERYGRHDYGCAATTSNEGLDVWAVVECTCRQQTLYGAHDLGCPRAAAFKAWREAEDAKPQPECNCGFAAALASTSIDGVSGTGLEELREAIETELEMIPQKPDAFDKGAAAAYNYVLSRWPVRAALAKDGEEGGGE